MRCGNKIFSSAFIGARIIDLKIAVRSKFGCVRVVNPCNAWRRVAVRLTNKHLGITSEDWDCPRKLCGIDLRFIC